MARMIKSFLCAAFSLALSATSAFAFDTPYLTFRSASSFSLSATKRWDGTLQKATGNPTDEASWSDWTGSSISAGLSDGQYYIYLRGKDNTRINNTSSSSSPFTLSGATADIYCEGDIETLRDYEGNPPDMVQYCYAALFKEWTRLVSPPVMSATTLAEDCYRNMFQGCTALKSIPALPATTAPNRCYYYMFKGCTSLEVNTTAPGVEWAIPSGTVGTSIWNYDMFADTSGAFTGNPVAGTTYYVASALSFGEIYQIGGKGTLDLALVGFSVDVDLSPTVKNGTAPYTFTFSSGTMPPGLNVSGNTLSGMPTTAGNYAFSLSVTDSESHTPVVLNYTMQVVQPAIVETTFVGVDGSPITTNCITLTTAMTTLNQAWYVASGTLNYGTGGIKVSGDVNLVLADGATMTVQGAAKKAGVNIAPGNSLTIYGQAEGTGTLNASGNFSDGFDFGGAGIGGNDKENAGTVTINGGTINATGSQYTAAGIGGGKSGNGGTVTINGGTVTATGGAWYGAGIGGGQGGNGGNVTINGGTVTATAGSQGAGAAYVATGIGRGYGYGPIAGTLTVGPMMSVKAGSDANPTEEIGRGGLITIGTQRYFVVEKAGLLQTENAFSAYANELKNWNLADTISGGTTTYTFALKSGSSLPAGLGLDGTTITGKVAIANTYTFTYEVTDSSATPLTLDATYTLTVTAPDPITAATNLTATVGKAKSFNIAETISGGVPPYSLAFSGTEPTGFSYNDGVLSGTATEANTYNFTITATDSLGTEQVLNYTLVTAESTGFIDDDPEEPVSGDSVDCRTADGVVRSRTCNQITDSSTTVTWTDSWYYIAPNTTVTLSAGAIVSGKVSLVLGDGATLTISSSTSGNAGIKVIVDGSVTNSLTIYGQSAGTGTLNVSGAYEGAGIGSTSVNNEQCGKVTINGGNIIAQGNSYAAGIGGGGNYGKGGLIVINGGSVTATTVSSASGIGGGWNGPGGDVVINGGSVTATGGSSSYAGIGGNNGKEQGTLKVGANVVVKADTSTPLTDEDIRTPNASGYIDLTTVRRYYLVETIGPVQLSQTTSAFTAYVGDAFTATLADTVSGGTPSYTFVQKSGTLPTGLVFANGVISGAPVAAGSASVVFMVTDSGTGADAQSEDFTYTFTVTAKPKKITYYNGAVEITGLTPTNYVEGTATTLAPTAPAATGYAFAGWYDNAGLAGLPVTAISAVATGDQTFWAKWTPIEYTITYMDGTTPMTGLTPTNYTIEAAATLPATATKAGYGFYGWYTNSTFSGSEVTTIPAGSTGNKTFYAQWGVVKVNTPYVDAYGNSMPQQLCAEVTSETTTLATGWYVVNGEVSINGKVTISGNVNLILADGAILTVTSSVYGGAIDLKGANTLTIYGQENGTGALIATKVAESSGPAIGSTDSSNPCGTLTINGGTITATGDSAGIGGGWNVPGGTVVINGGDVTATGGWGSAGIGGAGTGNGGDVTINGGRVVANGGESGGSGIGGGRSATSQGTLTVASRVTVKAGSSENPATVLNPNGETDLTSSLTGQRFFTFETVGPTPLTQATSAIAAYVGEAFLATLADTVSGGTPSYTFVQKLGTLPTGLTFANGVISGTPTAAGSATVVFTVADSGIGTDAQSADFTYTFIVTARPKTITYYNGAVEITGLTPSNYVEGVGATLPATAPAEAGYELEGWYKTAECNPGDKVTAISAEDTGNKAFYAKWKTIVYNVVYMKDSTTQFDDPAATTYTVESATLTLPATAVNGTKTFDGWYDNAGCTGVAITEIPHGSTGDRTFYAKWGAAKSNETYVDASGNTMPAVECTSIESDSTELATGWYVVKGNVSISTFVSVSGHAKLILADGATLTIQSDNSYKAGINIPSYASLTVYAQTAAGTGSLVVTGGGLASGIGGEYNESPGSITINGGTVTATATSGGAGIGGGQNGAGGTVVINNGTVTAIGGMFGAGIGGGYQGSGGTVTINGGTVTAYSSGYGAGIGKGSSGSSNGSLTVGANMIVESGDDAGSATELGRGGAIALDGLRYYVVRKAGVAPLAQTASTYAIYVGEPFELALTNTVRGGSGSYSFTLKDGSSLPAWLTCSGDTLSGTPTAEGVCSFTFTVEDTVETTLADLDCTYTITASIRPTPIIYMDGAEVMTGLTPSNYIEGVGTNLAEFVNKTGYLHLGWYTAAIGGERVDSISAEATGPQTVYAHWTTQPYSITYKDGNTTLTGLSPTTYYIETATFSLPEPLAPEGKVFVGWYSDSGLNTPVTSIPQGSTGNKTFWVKWRDAEAGEGEMLVSYIDADGSEHEELCKVMTAAMTTLESGWYAVNSDALTINTTVTIDGNVRIVLIDGKSLTVNAKTSSYTMKPGIWVPAGNTLTIYGQSGGTGALTATGDDYGAGIGSKFRQTSGSITINGGVITATGVDGGAGIGGGSHGTNGVVIINRGTVTASGSNGTGAGIGGGGADGYGGSITINGGEVTAIGGTLGGAGIGGGEGGDGGVVTITGGTVVATSHNGAGIGGSDKGNGATVTITGGSVTATSDAQYRTGIGGGYRATSNGTLTIGAGMEARAGQSQNPADKLNVDSSGVVTLVNKQYYVVDDGSGPIEPTVYTITYYVDDYERFEGLVPSNYVEGVGTVLATPADKPGYTFAGWYTLPSFFGDRVTQIGAEATGNKQFWAKWEKVAARATVEYLDVDDVVKSVECAILENGVGLLTNGWYAVTNEITVTSGLVATNDVKLILADGASLTVSNTFGKAGINVSADSSLTLYGQTTGDGALTATGGNNGAGIGGNNGQTGGTVIINGGVVTATGSQGGAGIGGGYNGACGSVTINGGTVEAIGGSGTYDKGAGIGGGGNGSGGTVVINGGTVTATSGGQSAEGIGRGSMGESRGSLKAGEDVVVRAGNTANPTESLTQTNEDGTFLILSIYRYYTAEKVSATSEFTITYKEYLNNTETVLNLAPATYQSGTGVANLPTPAAKTGYTFGGWWTSQWAHLAEEVAEIPVGSSGDKVLWAKWTPNVYEITYVTTPMTVEGLAPTNFTYGTGVASLPEPESPKPYWIFDGWYDNDERIGDPVTSIAGNATDNVTLYAKWIEDATRKTSVTFQGASGVQTENCRVLDTTVTELEGGWYVVTNDLEYTAGLSVTGNVNLVLVDGMTLSITNGTYLSRKAGINVPAGNSLTIYGQANGTGAIEAFGANWGAAGIGGNHGEDCGTVTIYGVVVMATGGDGGAGIGGGYNGDGGTVVINGGEVSAYSINYGAGIGGGQSGNGGSVTINGGTVVATSESRGAGIGGGCDGDGGTVAINGGTVTATSVLGGAGIGKGNGGSVEVALTVASGYGVYAGDEEDPISTFDVDGETGAVAITATRRYFVVKPATAGPEFRIVDGVLVEANLKGNTEITLPDTVTSIGAVVFRNNTSLESVVIPNSVKDIGDRSFYGCSNLVSVTIGSGVTNITSDAFYGCTALTGLAIPGNVEYIGEYAFKNCKCLATLTLGEGVKVIGDEAFYGCSALTSTDPDGIYFPDSIGEIGASAFVSCPLLAKVSLPGTMYVPGAPMSQSFAYDTKVTYRTDQPVFYISNGSLRSVDTKGNTSVTIPTTVKEIGPVSFHGITTLERVTIPSSVTNISMSAFGACSNLVEVSLAEGLEYIKDGAFEDCTSLTNVTIPASAVVVGRQSFWRCTALETATILAGKIGNEAFDGCTNLTTVVFGNGVTGIGDSAFRGCTPLTSVTIPGGVAEIGYSAFAGCSNIVELTISPGVAKTIGIMAFSSSTSLAALTLGEGITNIAEFAFNNCTALTTLAIPDSVETIGDRAFSGCENLVTLTFGSGLKTIGASAFLGCGALENDADGLYFPDTLVSVGAGVFNMCNKLTKVSLPGSLYANGTIHPSFDYWNVTVDYRGVAPVFYVAEDGLMRSVALKGASNITIPTTVKNLSSAFYGLQEIESVTIPSSVTNIKADAFCYCSNLVSVTMAEGLQAIGGLAFASCTSLKSVTIPDSVTKVEESAFWNCTSLESAILGSGMTAVPEWMFMRCKALESVTFRGDVTDIGNWAFEFCSALKEVSFTDSLSHIGHWAFADCDSLTSITIPKGVEIDMGAFSHCTSLASVNISGEVKRTKARAATKGRMLLAASSDPEATTVGAYAFNGCRNLEEATIGSKVEGIDGGVFSGCLKLNAITIESGNENYSSVDGLLLTKDGKTLVSAFGNETEITVPSSVTNILEGAFAGYSTLTNVILQSGVETIGEAAFSNATQFAAITIPSTVTSIGANAFCETALATVNVAKGDTARVKDLVEGTGYTEAVAYVEPGDGPVVTENWPENPASVEGQTASAAFGITGELANAKADDLATWAKAKGVDYANREEIIPDAFLLNCANNAAAVATATEEAEEAIEITAITIVNGVPQLTYPATYGNGQVVIQGSANIGASASWHDGKQSGDRFFKTVLRLK